MADPVLHTFVDNSGSSQGSVRLRLVYRGRHLVRAEHHRERRGRSFLIWDAVTIAA